MNSEGVEKHEADCRVAYGILAVTAGGGQETSMTASELNAEAVKAYQGKDYGRFLAYEKRALDLDPTNERFIYNVACGEALLGNARGRSGCWVDSWPISSTSAPKRIPISKAFEARPNGTPSKSNWLNFASPWSGAGRPSSFPIRTCSPQESRWIRPVATSLLPACGSARSFAGNETARSPISFSRPRMDSLRGIPLRWIPLGIFSMRRLPQFLTCWATSNKILAARECLRLILNQASWRERPCSRPMASAICSTRWWSITMVPCMFPTRAHRAFTCYSLVQAN